MAMGADLRLKGRETGVNLVGTLGWSSFRFVNSLWLVQPSPSVLRVWQRPCLRVNVAGIAGIFCAN